MEQRKGVCPKCGKAIAHECDVPYPEVICSTCEKEMMGLEEQYVEKKVEKSLKNGRKYPNIDVDLCVGCGNCVDICPKGAIKLVNPVATISLDQCKGCRICVNACSVGAIS